MNKAKKRLHETLEVGGLAFPLKIHYENRRNSSVSIRSTGINIRIPSFLPYHEKKRILENMKQWALQKIRKGCDPCEGCDPRGGCDPSGGKFMPQPVKEYENGDTIAVGNSNYTLNIKFKNKKSSSAKIEGKTICLSISSNLTSGERKRHVSALLSRAIGAHRLWKLKVKIKKLNQKHFNQKINKILFKNNRSNWGSCSRAGNINISTRMLFAPEEVLEYVCIHELAHLIEMSHSAKFWKLVKKAMPDYKEKEKWLKENSDRCYF